MNLRDRIIDAFLTSYGLTPALLFGTNPVFAPLRKTAMYLLHEPGDDTFEEIAQLFHGETPESVKAKVIEIEMERTDPEREYVLQELYKWIDKPYGLRTRKGWRGHLDEALGLDVDGEGFHRRLWKPSSRVTLLDYWNSKDSRRFWRGFPQG